MIATDDKGNFLTLDGKEWKPAQVAKNASGETLVLDGNEWVSSITAPKPLGVEIPKGGLTEQGHSSVRGGLPIAGATALTIGTGGAGILPLMGLAALGAAGGEGFGQLYDVARGKPPLPPEEAVLKMGKEAALAAGGEGIMGWAVKVGGKLVKPGTEAGERALHLAERAGLPVSRGSIAPSTTTKIFKTVSELTPFGKLTADHYRKQLINKSSEYASNFVSKTLGKIEKPSIDIAAGLGKHLEKIQDFGPAYQEWNSIIREVAAFDKRGGKKVSELMLDETSNFLAGKVEDLMAKNVIPRGEAKREIIEGIYVFQLRSEEGVTLSRLMDNDVIPVKDAETLSKSIWKEYKKQAESTIEARKALKELIIGDIDNQASAIGIKKSAEAAKEAGDKIYGEINEFLKKTPILEQFTESARFSPGKARFEAYPEKMLDLLTKKGSADELLAVKKFITSKPKIEGVTLTGPEVWSGVEFKYLNDLVESAMTRHSTTGELVFQPAKFSDMVNSKADFLKTVFPDSWKNISDFAEMSKGIGPDFKAMESGIVERMAPSLALSGAAGVASPLVTTVVNGFGALTAFNMLSGASQKNLSKWLLSPAAKTFKVGVRAGLQVGGRKVFDKMEEERTF